MREPSAVRVENTPSAICAAQPNMLSISQMAICLRARLVMANRPRPFTGMVMRMPPIIPWVATENTRPTSSRVDNAEAMSFRPGRMNT